MKKRVIFFSAFLLFLTILKAAYLEKLPYKITQPNGTTINCFVSGDEFFNWIHDEKGFTIIQAPNGYFYYAEQKGDLIQPSKYLVNSVDPTSVGLGKWTKISKPEYKRRHDAFFSFESESESGPSKAPTSGSLNNLAVYIRFSDETEFTTTRQIYDNSFNPTTGVSLKSYFQEVSYNNLTINTSHYPDCDLSTNLSYQDSHPRSYFQPYNATTNPGGYSNSTESREREHQLLVDAISWINLNSPVSPSLTIDGDGDDRVDNVCFIIRGSSGGWSDLLWAHRWALFSQTVYINGKRVYDYTFQPENQVSVKILCHEMFHALGAPDLYHYTSNGISPVGAWDLMESGGGHMLAYMKWKYSGNNWISTIPEITASGTYTLNPLTSATNNCYRIASPYSTDEYFMVEYRSRTGTFESILPGSGLLVYRVDMRETGNAGGPPDEVYIYRPNGTTLVNGNISSANFSSLVGRTAINDATNPGSFLQNGTAGGLNISNITAAEATISFDVSFAGSCTPPTIQTRSFTSTALSDNSMTPGWTRGNGDAVLVVAKAGDAVNTNPVNGISYSADAEFGSGTQLGEGNYVVYNGTGSSVNLTALSSGTTYHYAIYEYTTGTDCYLIPALVGNATTTGLPPYCTAGSPSTSFEYISNIAIGSINHASGRGINGYQDHTSQSTSLQIGENVSATISVTNPFTSDQIVIWVDWNQDNDFEDAGETVYTSGGAFTSPHTTANFAPPVGALIGTTRMRIRLHDLNEGANTTPCGTSTYGEVEDYSLLISGSGIIPPIIGRMEVSGSTNLTFSLDEVPGAIGYNVYRDSYVDFIPDRAGGTNRIATGFTDEDSGTEGIQWTDIGVIGDPSVNYYYIFTSVNGEESDNSVLVGEFDYSLITSASTNFNEIALPMEIEGIGFAADLMAVIPGCNSIARWNAPIQSYDQYVSFLPPSNFEISPGYPYYVNIDAATTFTFLGEPINPSFNLITTATTSFNEIMLPLNRTDITTASELLTEIPGCNSVARWNAATQGYDQYLAFLPPSNFDVNVGYPYYINVDADVVWPELSSGSPLINYMSGRENISVSMAPHFVYGEMDDFKADAKTSDLHFKASIIGRPGEILTEESAGCLLTDGYWSVQCATFNSAWNAGDILEVIFYDHNKSIVYQTQTELTFAPADKAQAPSLSIDFPATGYTLECSPNPFDEETILNYSIGTAGPVTVSIYSSNGELIKSLINDDIMTGTHTIFWDGTNNKNHKVSKGIYFVILMTNEGIITEKVIYSGSI